MAPRAQTNQQLGYPADARLLMVNADGFGMCHAVNDAIFRVLKDGIARSSTLLVPCPWTLHAIHFLADHPDIAFGIHLTAICDGADYRWGPVTAREKVPSLLDRSSEKKVSYSWTIDPCRLFGKKCEFIGADGCICNR